MPKTPKKMVRLLKSQGFIKLRHNGSSHAIYYNPENGKRAVAPMHSKELKIGTERRILKDAGIDE